MVAVDLFLSFSLAGAVSVIPGTGYSPAAVRAACRSTLSQTLTGCSDLIQYPENYVDLSSLEDVCTTQCRQSLSDMYTKAVSACGITGVHVTTNTTSELLVPLDSAEKQGMYIHSLFLIASSFVLLLTTLQATQVHP